jgi:hypothetical protein
LTEEYVTYVAENHRNGTRLGVVRSPNLLDEADELLLQLYAELAKGNSRELSQKSLEFTSAQNAATAILNSFHLQNKGEIFLDASGESYKIMNLVAEFSKFIGFAPASPEPAIVEEFVLNMPGDHNDFMETGVPGVRVRFPDGGESKFNGNVAQLDSFLDSQQLQSQETAIDMMLRFLAA